MRVRSKDELRHIALNNGLGNPEGSVLALLGFWYQYEDGIGPASDLKWQWFEPSDILEGTGYGPNVINPALMKLIKEDYIEASFIQRPANPSERVNLFRLTALGCAALFPKGRKTKSVRSRFRSNATPNHPSGSVESLNLSAIEQPSLSQEAGVVLSKSIKNFAREFDRHDWAELTDDHVHIFWRGYKDLVRLKLDCCPGILSISSKYDVREYLTFFREIEQLSPKYAYKALLKSIFNWNRFRHELFLAQGQWDPMPDYPSAYDLANYADVFLKFLVTDLPLCANAF